MEHLAKLNDAWLGHVKNHPPVTARYNDATPLTGFEPPKRLRLPFRPWESKRETVLRRGDGVWVWLKQDGQQLPIATVENICHMFCLDYDNAAGRWNVQDTRLWAAKYEGALSRDGQFLLKEIKLLVAAAKAAALAADSQQAIPSVGSEVQEAPQQLGEKPQGIPLKTGSANEPADDENAVQVTESLQDVSSQTETSSSATAAEVKQCEQISDKAQTVASPDSSANEFAEEEQSDQALESPQAVSSQIQDPTSSSVNLTEAEQPNQLTASAQADISQLQSSIHSPVNEADAEQANQIIESPQAVATEIHDPAPSPVKGTEAKQTNQFLKETSPAALQTTPPVNTAEEAKEDEYTVEEMFAMAKSGKSLSLVDQEKLLKMLVEEDNITAQSASSGTKRKAAEVEEEQSKAKRSKWNADLLLGLAQQCADGIREGVIQLSTIARPYFRQN